MITLDKSLTYIKHIQSCISNVSHKMFILSKIRPYINTNIAITIYKNLIVPFLDYGDILFINASIELLNKLQRLQNKCLRICLRAHPQTPTFFLHQETKTAPLHDRRKAHLRSFMFKQRDNLDLLDNRDLHTRQHTGIIFKVQLQRLQICKKITYFTRMPLNGTLYHWISEQLSPLTPSNVSKNDGCCQCNFNN